MLDFYPLSTTQIDDPFWKNIQDQIRKVVLPYQWEILNDRVEGAEPSHCIENFRIVVGDAQGEYQGAVFQDSDVYKWLEAVAYSLAIQRDEELESHADQAIDLISRAQGADGYLNTYYTIKEPQARFHNLTEGHELYCAGHLMEAAVAYYEATGKCKLLDVAVRLGECLLAYFQPEEGKNKGYPGHPEVELALVRLYQATGRKEFMILAEYFLNVRGQGTPWRDVELERGGFSRIKPTLFEMPLTYFLAHQPLREQRVATGHAVRAMYLYSAMADVARLQEDEGLRQACLALQEDVACRQMYVTGGIGSTAFGERFTVDYDLPNDSVYAETCASVGLTMFSSRMWLLTGKADCYDAWEKALYNTVLACMSQDGEHFFYVNPLEVRPEAVHANKGLEHVETKRLRWFGVACCPPNMARCVLSLGGKIFAKGPDAFYVLSHMSSQMQQNEEEVRLVLDGDHCALKVQLPQTTLKLRVPEGFTLTCEQGTVEDGYCCIPHPGGLATYAYRLIPQIRLLHAHPHIAQDVGKLCCSYGQTIYCLEEADNGKALCALALSPDTTFQKVQMDWLPEGMVALRAQGVRFSDAGWREAYAIAAPKAEPATLTFIPYSQWNNRGEGEMCVWVNQYR